MGKPLTLRQARELAQELANQTNSCHIICDRDQHEGFEVVDARKVTGDDLGDSVDFRYPGEET